MRCVRASSDKETAYASLVHRHWNGTWILKVWHVETSRSGKLLIALHKQRYIMKCYKVLGCCWKMIWIAVPVEVGLSLQHLATEFNSRDLNHLSWYLESYRKLLGKKYSRVVGGMLCRSAQILLDLARLTTEHSLPACPVLEMSSVGRLGNMINKPGSRMAELV